MILADTSAWVEYDRATGSRVDDRMIELIAARLVVVTEPVAMEMLAGARSDSREQDLQALLMRFEQEPVQAGRDFGDAARVYRRCRSVGVTPHGLLDCLIVTIARRGGHSLLAQDVEVRRVAEVMGVALDPATA